VSALVFAFLAMPLVGQGNDDEEREPKPRSDPAAAQLAQVAGWTVEWSPYLWATGLDGDVGIHGRVTTVSLSFADLIENKDGALFLPVEMRKGRWSVLMELMLLQVSGQAAAPVPLVEQVKVSAEQTLIELSLRYRMVEQERVSADVIAGARTWHLSDQLDLATAGQLNVSIQAGELWLDPIVGGRGVFEPADRWSVILRGDIGGFGVGSDLTWQALGNVGYALGDKVTLRAGYRHLAVDFEDDEAGFTFDVENSGPIIGVSVRP
jgi:hypothetical protein